MSRSARIRRAVALAAAPLLLLLALSLAGGGCTVRNLSHEYGRTVDRFFDRQARRGASLPIPFTGEEAEIAIKNYRLDSTKSETKTGSTGGDWIKLSR